MIAELSAETHEMRDEFQSITTLIHAHKWRTEH